MYLCTPYPRKLPLCTAMNNISNTNRKLMHPVPAAGAIQTNDS